MKVQCSDDCKDDIKSTLQTSEGAVHVYCLEPSQANFAQLIITRDAFFKNNKKTVQWCVYVCV